MNVNSVVVRKMRRIPGVRSFLLKGKMTDRERQLKQERLNRALHIRECLLSTGWVSGVKPLIEEMRKQLRGRDGAEILYDFEDRLEREIEAIDRLGTQLKQEDSHD